jgi:signal transduction histidine kinase
MGVGELRRIERWLASARLALAIPALFSLWFGPTYISRWGEWLLGIYVIHGTVVMLLLRYRKRPSPAFLSLVYVADLVWPAAMSAFVAGTQNPFFLLFVFMLVAAAYRWGLRETIGTAAACLILLWAESIAVRWGSLMWVEGFLLRHHWPPLGIDVVELEPKHMLIRSVYLLVMGWLLGYLADQHTQLRAEVERGRFVRDLHDTALQSLIGVAMQIDVLSRHSTPQTISVPRELARIHNLLLEEARKLRELMQAMKPLDVEAENLRAHLRELVDRLHRETGITTRFVCASTLTIRPREICEALARIVQEALVNVRKHSGATQVLVQLDSWNGYWRLAIDDNGHGFPFSGCFSWADLEREGRGPLVIKEYVHLIHGELTLDSVPERGSRLVITIPQRRPAGLRTTLGLIEFKFIEYFRHLRRRFT